MLPEKIINRLTEECIDECELPKAFYPIIYKHIQRSFAAGTDNGTQQPTHWRPIVQYSLDNIFIAYFDSVKEASKKTNISRRSIGGVCRGEYPSVKGFIFKYARTDQK